MGDVVGSAVGGLFGGGSGSGPHLSTWQAPGMNQLANQYVSTVGQNQNPFPQYAPQFQQVYGQQFNNPYAQGQQNSANQAGAAYGQVGNSNIGASQQLTGAALAGLPAATQALNMSMDPQNALYNRTSQQLQDQVRTNAAQRGITNSPYGAGVENQAMSNFNIDWQNNALQRAMQGLQGYGNAVGSATQAATGAGNLGTAGAGNILEGGTVPYSTSMGQSNNQYAALQQLMAGLTGGNQINQQTLAEIMPYLNLGAGQANQQANLNMDNWQAKQQDKNAASGFGSMIGGGLFGSGGSGGIGDMLSMATLFA